MLRPGLAIVLAACMFLTACTASAPAWRKRVEGMLNDLGRQGAPKLYPQEFRSLLETFEHGDAVYFVQKDSKAADTFYRLAFQKSEFLRLEVERLKERQAEEERQKAAAEAARLAEERLNREAAEAELRLLEQEKAREQEKRQQVVGEKQPGKVPVQQLSTTYTVRRGETLPQIAGRPEIYDDASMWPIIYRANRDQIRDPKRLWPGQVLAIPRHYSRDDVHDARKYSGKK